MSEVKPKETGLVAVEGAEGFWEATYWNPDDHDARFAFVAKACKSKEAKEKLDEAEAKYKAGDLPACVYVERMMVCEMPKKDGLLLYSCVPITDDLKAQVTEKGGAKVIVVPTGEHALHHKGWIDAFPEAVVVCPGGGEMQATIDDLGDKAKVIDSRTPSKWSKDAIKALSGIGCEVLDTGGFQEIILMHRKSKTLMTCDSIYLTGSKKDDPSGFKNFPCAEWAALYWEGYMDRSPAWLPVYRTFIPADAQKVAGKVWKKVIAWKPERVVSGRSGKVSTGGAKNAKEILEGHWKWCVDVA